MTDLALPCPFCGKAPELHPHHPERDGNAWGEVRCSNMRCATYDQTRGHGVSVRDGTLIADERGSMAYKQAAIRRWNVRR